jgi:oligoendopeptidase F
MASSNAATGVQWDLSALYDSPEDPKIDESWQKAHQEADGFIEKYRSTVASGLLAPDELAGALAAYEMLTREAVKPVLYANLLFAADTSDPKLGAFLQEQSEKLSELRVKLIFFELELQEAEDGYIDKVLADRGVENYRHFIEISRKNRPYKLSEIEETLLEETANVGSRAWVRLHEELTANQTFQFVDPETGEEEELSQEEVLNRLRSEKREIRDAAANSLTVGLSELERTIVFTYNTLLADKKLEDKLRDHPFPENSRHLSNELDKETVDLVMGMCKERGDLVARYYKVKKQILGIDKLDEADRYAPLFEARQEMNWDSARDLVLQSFGEFHPELEQAGKEFFENNWIDAEPRAGKGGGAFCSYNTPDTHPVLLQTYLGKLDDVMTLAHELGHGVHASLSRVQTYFNYHGTLPLAELASIFGEMLVFEKVTKDTDVRDNLALYGQKLEGIFASVHRQAAMFRFEQRCHEMRRAKGELSADDFGDIWQEEMQSMFGDTVELTERHRKWWLYVGHFFFAPFYVYAYSFGELLTLSLYQKAQEEGPGFAQKYVDVLKQGGSYTPHELMSDLDVDLRSEAFWQRGFDAIESMVSKFEGLWSKYSAG